MKGNVNNETATFQIKKGEKFDEAEARAAIETKAKFQTGKIVIHKS